MKAEYDYDQLFPGRFLKSGEFGGKQVTFTISDVEIEEMEDRKGKRMKCIVTFRETKKQLVLNKTNGECLKGMWGRKVSVWIGKRITFMPVTVEAFGAPTLAIRVLGSPDIDKDMEVVCSIGRQTDVRAKMKKTGVRPPTIYERICITCDEYGVPKDERGKVLKAATGKENAKQLVEDDIAKVQAHLAAGAPVPPPASGPEADDVPF